MATCTVLGSGGEGVWCVPGIAVCEGADSSSLTRCGVECREGRCLETRSAAQARS